MAVWTAPTTRSTGALVSASIWNTDIVENLKYLKDSPVFDGDVTVGDDLFLGSGAVINIASGDVTITHSTNTLTFAGASSGYVFNDGNVGIGVTPVANTLLSLLSAATNQQYVDVLRLETSDTGDRHPAIQFVGNRGGTAKYAKIAMDGGSTAATGDLVYFAEDEHQFYTGSGTSASGATLRMRLTSGGNLALSATARIYLDGSAGTGDTYISEEGANVLRFTVGGASNCQLDTTGIYLNTAPPTTASAANAWVGSSSDYLRRSTSSLRYKHAVETLDTADAKAALMAMRPVTYRGKTDEDQRRYVGFLAEEMQQVAPLLCTYDEGGESGTANYVTYDRVTAYLVAVVQQQQAEIDALKARIH